MLTACLVENRALSRWFPTLLAALLLIAPAALTQSTSSPTEDFDSLLHRAFDFHQQNDYAQALPLLRRAWTMRPHDYFVNLLIGIDLLRSGSPSEAVRFLREAGRLRPKEEFPPEYMGEAEAALKHYGDAAEAFSQGLRVAPDSSQAAIAYVDFSLARFAEMSARLRSSRRGLAAEYRLQALAHPAAEADRLSLLQRAVELDGSAPGIWGEIALAQAAGGKTPEAEEALAKARSLEADRENGPTPGRSDLRGQEAEAMLVAQKGDWAAAARRLNDIARASPIALADAITDWPVTLLPAGNPSAPGAAGAFLTCVASHCSRETLRKRLASVAGVHSSEIPPATSVSSAGKAPQTPNQLRRGVEFAELDQCERAIPTLERALSQRQDIYGMFLLSWCYAQQAGGAVARLGETGGDEAQIHMIRGDVLLRLQANSLAAQAEYQAALAKHPNDPAILQRLAEAQLSAGAINDARANAEAALKLDPHRFPAMRTLAKIAMEARDYDSALQYLRPLTTADPSDLNTRIELGTACAQTGNLDEALQNLQPALQKGYPDEKGSLHYQLGTVLRKLGKTAEADQAFATARELSDSFQRGSRREVSSEPH